MKKKNVEGHFEANRPGPVFRNRLAHPLVALSLPMAADRVAAGVLPLGLAHSLRVAIALTSSGQVIGSLASARTRAAARRALSFSAVALGVAFALRLAGLLFLSC